MEYALFKPMSHPMQELPECTMRMHAPDAGSGRTRPMQDIGRGRPGDVASLAFVCHPSYPRLLAPGYCGPGYFGPGYFGKG
ncbi:hypothetical protein AA21291_0381 [Swaminathania salitolerans LMG 21291]|uniref:Uncharacterized protein n=1 Tax=Swaminathania salitolerans TaxID=182838 RepID=A0A511BLL7_9PROT|nr:hypothetical protein AA21291_0381 [Swaminathania salitolerans LMG 21291]GEL01240.1 hypothetical protein SSA02_04030 [Swaminathania salitolerans]